MGGPGVIGTAVAFLGVLALSFVEQATNVVMLLIALAALTALVLGVKANRRLDRHLRETHEATGQAREMIQEIIAAVDDE